MNLKAIRRMAAFASKTEVNVVVETPQGSRNKFDFNPENGLFELGSAMPAGVTFPFEFGFIPSTLGMDGDPLDVLILMDAPTFVGCVAKVRLIGVIEAKQTGENGKLVRNDRLVGVATESRRHEGIKHVRDVPPELVKEIECFFADYNEIKGRRFKMLGCHGPATARRLVKAGMRLAKNGG